MTVPHDDVEAAVKLQTFNYHIVDIKSVVGERNWSEPLEWVAQPYYAKLRCGNVGNLKNRSPPWDVLDGMITLTSMRRKSHIGPFPEHDSLRACISRGSEAYKMRLRSHFIMWHVSVHSE